MASSSSSNICRIELPELDLNEAKKDKVKAAQQLKRNLKEVGFVYITNSLFKPNETLNAIKWFFHLPLEQKMMLSAKTFNPSSVNVFRGYWPVLREINPDLKKIRDKERFEFGRPNTSDLSPKEVVLCEENVWPDIREGDAELQKQAENFRSTLEDCYKLLADVSLFLLELISIAFELEDNEIFKNMFPSRHQNQDHLSVARIFHYLGEGTAGESVALNAHTDSGFITLLSNFHYKGLQVFHKGEWCFVPPSEDKLILNIGDLMEELFGHELKATLHRVIDQGEERYALPFFYNPSFDAVISHTITGQPVNSITINSLKTKTYGFWRSVMLKQRPENHNVDFKLTEQ